MDEEESKPPFRANQQMMVVLAVVLALLVIPLGMFGFFLYDFFANDRDSAEAAPSDALEQLVQQAAESAFPMDTDLAKTLLVSHTVITSTDIVEQTAKKLGGEVVFRDPGEDGFGRVLLRLPESRVEVFEAAMKTGEPVGEKPPVSPGEETTNLEVIVGE